MGKIVYTDKVNLKITAVPLINKVQAENLNEIKSVVNDNDDELIAHVGDSANPHLVTKAQVGLGSVPNTDFTADVAANTAKVPNATHTSEVTGATALTVDKSAITNKTTVTASAADFVLISDTSDSGNLKKVLVSELIKNYTYEISFNEVLEVLQRFTVATNITAITAYNVATLKYSIDGASDVTVSLPFAGTISLTANQRIVWKITYTASPTLAVLNLTATEV